MANTFKNSTLKSVGTSVQNVYAAGAGVQSTVIGMTVANMVTTPKTGHSVKTGVI